MHVAMHLQKEAAVSFKMLVATCMMPGDEESVSQHVTKLVLQSVYLEPSSHQSIACLDKKLQVELSGTSSLSVGATVSSSPKVQTSTGRQPARGHSN